MAPAASPPPASNRYCPWDPRASQSSHETGLPLLNNGHAPDPVLGSAGHHVERKVFREGVFHHETADFPGKPAAKEKSASRWVSREIATDGTPMMAPSVAAETVPE